MRKEAIVNFVREQPAKIGKLVKEQPSKTVELFKKDITSASILSLVSFLSMTTGGLMAIDSEESAGLRVLGALFALYMPTLLTYAGNVCLKDLNRKNTSSNSL